MPNITLTPSPAVFVGTREEEWQDKRFLRLPRGEVGRRRVMERGCEGGMRCRCAKCGKKRSVKIAAIKRRRQKRRKEEGDEGERSEVEG